MVNRPPMHWRSSAARGVSHDDSRAGLLQRNETTMVTTLIRAIELAVFTPFRALAAISAVPTHGHEPLDEPVHDEDR
jgi:hypothetical protein